MLRASPVFLAANAWSVSRTLAVGQWVCRCGRVNAKFDVHCRNCNRHRPADAEVVGKWRCAECASSNGEERKTCWNCARRRTGTSLATSAATVAHVKVRTHWDCRRCGCANGWDAKTCRSCYGFRSIVGPSEA
jgi:ribosomal protein L40E